jgi:hypothetical protein
MNRAAFLALRDEVKQALDDGWPIKEIWETLHEEGGITFSYTVFCRYVKRHIVRAPLDLGSVAAGKKRRREPEPERSNSIDKNSTTGIRGFTWNPIPNEDDLI